METPFIIFSTPRSRSTLLTRILDTTPGVCCNGECPGFLVRLKALYEEQQNLRQRSPASFSSLERQIADRHFPSNLNHSDEKVWGGVFIHIIRAWVNPSSGENVWGMKDVHIGKDGAASGFEMWSWLQRVIPNMKFIFLTRDEGAVVASMNRNRHWWISSHGSDEAEWRRRMRIQSEAFRDYHALNPSTTVFLDAEVLMDFDEVSRRLARVGIPVAPIAHAGQASIKI